MLFYTHHLIHIQRLRFAFDRKRRKRYCLDLILHTLIRFSADQNLILGAILLDAFGRVDTVADGGVFESLLGADPSQYSLPIMDSHAKIEMSFFRQFRM
jgi:hypothetical protein